MSFEDSDVVRSAVRVEGFRDDEFNYQLIRALGVADYGGSTVGECLAVVAEITDGSPTAGPRAFERLAQRVEDRGRDCLAAGRRVSGRDHLLRASTYYRTAEYYGGGIGWPVAGAAQRSQACFARGRRHCSTRRWSGSTCPSRGDRCPATWSARRRWRPDRGARGPPWSGSGGFDSSAEELYFQLGAPGAERGWNVFVFDGPGQLGCMRTNPALTFRPDYEVPLAAVLDAVIGSRRRRRRPGGAGRPELRLVLRRPVGRHRPPGRRPGGQPAGGRHGPLHGGVGRDRRLPDDPGHPSRGRDRRARGPDAPADAVGDRGHLQPFRRAVLPRLAGRHGRLPPR